MDLRVEVDQLLTFQRFDQADGLANKTTKVTCTVYDNPETQDTLHKYNLQNSCFSFLLLLKKYT